MSTYKNTLKVKPFCSCVHAARLRLLSNTEVIVKEHNSLTEVRNPEVWTSLILHVTKQYYVNAKCGSCDIMTRQIGLD